MFQMLFNHIADNLIIGVISHVIFFVKICFFFVKPAFFHGGGFAFMAEESLSMRKLRFNGDRFVFFGKPVVGSRTYLILIVILPFFCESVKRFGYSVHFSLFGLCIIYPLHIIVPVAFAKRFEKPKCFRFFLQAQQ